MGLALCVAPCIHSTTTSPSTFLYVLQAESLANTKRAVVKRIASSGRDWIILDANFQKDKPWTKSDLKTIRAGKLGRKILAYLSIGEAEDYRSYWLSTWKHEGALSHKAPSWILEEDSDWHGNYHVKYWDPDWQKIIIPKVYELMKQGFDGVYLDRVDGFEQFEKKGGDYVDGRINPETKQTYRKDMVDWVKSIAACARNTNPRAIIVPQNGVQLLRDSDFFVTISAIGIEDLFTDGNSIQDTNHTKEVLYDLQKIKSVRKPILVTEYPESHRLRVMAEKKAGKNNLIWLITDRELKRLGVSGN